MSQIRIIRVQSGAPGPGSAPLRRRLAEFARLHNPFYLASALCMLAGCYLLANSVSGSEWSARMTRVGALLGALNLYELLVIALACYLIARRKLVRDGKMLLLIETLFLVDSTYLLAETYALDFWVGARVNLAALILSAVKVGIVLRFLELRFAPRELAAAAAAYLGLLAAPGILAAYNRTGAPMSLPIHGVWWMVGLLLPVMAVLVPRERRERRPLEAALGKVALVAAWVSLLAHVIAAHWVHEARFYVSNLAPVLVGAVAAALLRSGARPLRRSLRALLAGAGALSVILAAFFPPALTGDVFGIDGLVFSPLRGVLLALAAVCLCALLLGRGRSYAFAASGLLLAGCGGHSPPAIAGNWGRIAAKVIPKTTAQWGVVALLAALAFLGAGAAVSLLTKVPGAERD